MEPSYIIIITRRMVQWHGHFRKKSLAVSQIDKYRFTLRPNSCAFRHLLKRTEKICLQKKTYTQMFMESLYLIHEKWKQLKCSCTAEWSNKT